MAKRITKQLLAARAAFKQRVCEFLKAIGASEIDGAYAWMLKTPVGELAVSVWDSAIMCRFADVEQATAFTRKFTSESCNPYSGKWNWHFSDDADTLTSNCEAPFVQNVTLLMDLRVTSADADRTPA